MKVGDKIVVTNSCWMPKGSIGVCNTLPIGGDNRYRFKFEDGNKFWLFEDEYKPLKNEPKKDPIVKSVLKKYKQRSKDGIKKYGCTLEREDLTDEEWFIHLQSELMDATLYIERILKALNERK
jgi:hypothetical protein